MGIIYSKSKRSKQPNNSKVRQLAEEWAAMIEGHSKPLEKGAKAKGVNTKALKPKTATLLSTSSARPTDNSGLRIKSVPMTGAATKATPTPELAAAMKQVAGRTGAVGNKMGAQYLTDADIEEQKSGSHRRR